MAESIDRGFTHLDHAGGAIMVDVGDKPETLRKAEARGEVLMAPATLQRLLDRDIPKGDVLAVARIAGIMATKQTAHIIPLCHPIELSSVSIDFEFPEDRPSVEIKATVQSTGRTGVEMEALTAVSVAALSIYDMCKSLDRGMVINDIRLVFKSGGRSGTYVRDSGDERQ